MLAEYNPDEEPDEDSLWMEADATQSIDDAITASAGYLDEEHGTLFSHILQHQHDGLFCYLDGIDGFQEIRPNDSAEYVAALLSQELPKGIRLHVTTLWPEHENVLRGTQHRQHPPTAFDKLLGSKELLTVQSLRGLQTIIYEQDALDPTADVVMQQQQLLRAIIDHSFLQQTFASCRQLILELISQPQVEFQEMGDEYLADIRQRFQLLYTNLFSVEDIQLVKDKRRRRECASAFLKDIGVPVRAISTLKDLHTAIRTANVSMIFPYYQLYLDALATDVSPAITQAVIIPLATEHSLSTIRDVASNTLYRLGYLYDPQGCTWRSSQNFPS